MYILFHCYGIYFYIFLKLFQYFWKYNIFIDIDVQDIYLAIQWEHNLTTSEAEMTQYLCNIKMLSINCNTKKYCVPYFSYVLRDKIVHKYMARSNSFSSLVHWLLTQYIRWITRFLSSLKVHIYFHNNLVNIILVLLWFAEYIKI